MRTNLTLRILVQLIRLFQLRHIRMPPPYTLVLRYVLQPRRHQCKHGALQNVWDDPRGVDALAEPRSRKPVGLDQEARRSRLQHGRCPVLGAQG